MRPSINADEGDLTDLDILCAPFSVGLIFD